MANKTMLCICHLLNQCDSCDNRRAYKRGFKKEIQEAACAGCPVHEHLSQIRPLIDDYRSDKCKRILEKGEDMTTSEIVYLVKHNVKKTDIRDALGMNDAYFREMLQHLGLVRGKKAVSG